MSQRVIIKGHKTQIHLDEIVKDFVGLGFDVSATVDNAGNIVIVALKR